MSWGEAMMRKTAVGQLRQHGLAVHRQPGRRSARRDATISGAVRSEAGSIHSLGDRVSPANHVGQHFGQPANVRAARASIDGD